MKSSKILILFVVVFLLPIAVQAATPRASNGFQPEMNVDVWIDNLGSQSYYFTSLDSGDTIYVDIEVTSGSDIDFWICDETNYNLWSDGQSSEAHRIMNNVGSVSTSFNVPTSGTWYVVFSNDALFTRKHIEGWVGLTSEPITSPDYSALTGLSIVAIVAVVVIVGVAGVKKLTESSTKGTTAQYSAPVQQVYTPPKPDQAFCSSCGHPRQGLDARFCAKCGRAFEGPGFEWDL